VVDGEKGKPKHSQPTVRRVKGPVMIAEPSLQFSNAPERLGPNITSQPCGAKGPVMTGEPSLSNTERYGS
jgi:hypothetical protein